MTSTAISVVLLDELPEAVLLPDVEGVAGADGRDLLAEDLVVRPVEEAVDTGLGAGLEEEGSGAGFDVLAFVIFSYSLKVSTLNFLHLLFPSSTRASTPLTTPSEYDAAIETARRS